jgi:zinc transport system substrate-binding protein
MNVHHRLIPAAALAGAAALGLVTLSACSPSDAAGSGGDGRLTVAASFYPMEFLAEQIGGEHVSVTDLTKPGTEPHDLELSPRQTGELGEAGLIVYLKGLQPAVDEAVAQSGARNIAEVTTFTELQDHGTSVGHAGEPSTAESAAEEDPEGDTASDPHIWLDPVKYAEAAQGVGKAMAKADPDHAADYRKNTDALVGRLQDLDREFRDGLQNRTTDTFITTHAAFGYLADRYGLDQEAISGIDPESEPSPARMKELHEIAAKNKTSTVFFETLADDRTARTLADDTGLRTDVLDPIEGITDTSEGDDYLEVMQSNLTALRAALGAR